jgi:hypothetical protein
MWSTIIGIGGKALGAVMGWLGSAVQWFGLFMAYRLGKRKAQQEQALDAVEIKDEQLEIAARPVEHRNDVLDRLRRGGL